MTTPANTNPPPVEARQPAFSIQCTMDQLRQRTLFLGLPCYGGMCTASFAKSLAALAAHGSAIGVRVGMQFLNNESLIQRARNYIVDEFLRSDATHFMFIDSDIDFNPQDVMAMLALQSDDSPYDVLTAAYPKKSISWEKVREAVFQGVADEDPNLLENFVGDYVINPKADPEAIARGETRIELALNKPVEIGEAGTGFMMIKRKVFERFREAHPEQMYKPDHARSENYDGSREICAFFDCVIDPVSKRYLSEDYFFCQRVQALGMKIWLLPWMQLKHQGAYTFGGSLSALASIGVSPTVDPDKIKKAK